MGEQPSFAQPAWTPMHIESDPRRALAQAAEILKRAARRMLPASLRPAERVEPALELEEIQGLVVSGYGDRPCARFALFRIDDPLRARVWLGGLSERLQYADFMATSRAEEPRLAPVCLNLALTFEGLDALGLPQEALLGFSGPFRGGMSAPHRARLLGDDGESAPSRWRWGGPETPAIHGVLLVYGGSDDGEPHEDALCADVIAREVHEAHGVELVLVRETLPMRRDDRSEHFGFADGISNPRIRQLAHADTKDVIPPGEVLLGYPNAYDREGLSPEVSDGAASAALLPASRTRPGRRDFGKNGSYLVFRELSQDVASFWRFMERAAAELPDRHGPVWLASRVVGRWPNGLPVTLHPDLPGPKRAPPDQDFGYHEQGDFYGAACPIGSHVRRTNPRETLLPVPYDPPPTLDVTDAAEAEARRRHVGRHRLVRRGRSYGPRRAERFDLAALKRPDGVDRGLHFLCVVANLRRQFEFVQSSWAVSPHFAGLSRDPDPLIGAGRTHPFSASGFALPGCPARFVERVPRFVETRGGAYFFLPSRSALRYLAALRAPLEPPPALPEPRARELLALERDKVERAFAVQAAPRRAPRAFHTTCHGIVRAELVVDPNLPAAWEAGVFRRGARYPAWVRFSSGAFGQKPDRRRDVHGLAIKLMGVNAGERAAPFEAQTQDFVLIDAPRLFCAGIDDLLAFERASAAGTLALIAHLARNPRTLHALATLTSRPRHPLAHVYNSVTPFAYGSDRAVRWVVRLRQDQQLVETRGPVSLRAALRAQLAMGSIALELCVQNRGSRPIALDDARVDWKIPEERVATLTLLPDGFELPTQEDLGDRMSFNPWNGLRDHRPLGAMNAARRLVYRSLYELRMQLDGKLPFEPRP